MNSSDAHDALIRNPQFLVHHFPTLGSTSDHLKRMTGAPEFTCVVADEQTAGRGRRDRTWHSSPSDGLYLSVLLRPQTQNEQTPLLGLLAAVAVAETLLARGVRGVDIKWPNDVLLNERKVCGILAESFSESAGLRVILGIGANLNQPTFPDALRETATSVFIETGARTSVAEFRDQLLAGVAAWYEVWQRGQSPMILARWEELSSYARGCAVAVQLDEQRLTGITAGLTAQGALRLITDDGESHAVFVGEVSRLRKQKEDAGNDSAA